MFLSWKCTIWFVGVSLKIIVDDTIAFILMSSAIKSQAFQIWQYAAQTVSLNR